MKFSSSQDLGYRAGANLRTQWEKKEKGKNRKKKKRLKKRGQRDPSLLRTHEGKYHTPSLSGEKLEKNCSKSQGGRPKAKKEREKTVM